MSEQNTEKLLSGARKPVHPLGTKAFPKQPGKVDAPGAGLAAKLGKGFRREPRSVYREEIGCRCRPTVPSRGGVPREGGPWIAQGACGDPGRGSSPGPAPDPRAAEAVAYLPAGTRCADSSAPGPAASSWAQLRPAWSSCGQLRLEMISRHRRGRKASEALVTLGNSPGAQRAPPQRGWRRREGRGEGGCSLLVQGEARGGTRPGSPGVQDLEPRVGKFTGNLGEWPRAWDAGEGSRAQRRAREGGGAGSTAGRSLFLS